MKKRVLLVGGSMHGRWIEIDKREYVIRVPKPLDISAVWSEDPLTVSPLDDLVENYWVETVPFEINELRTVIQVGVWTSLHGVEKTKAMIHAVFQRDIAETFGEKGWNDFV